MRQYTVIKDKLNLRNVASAEKDESYVGVLLRGAIVELDETEIIGTIPNGASTNIWLKDNYNRFLHSEGLGLIKTYDEKKEEFFNNHAMNIYHRDSMDESIWKISWGHVDLDIWKIWHHPQVPTKGEGITIAVLDYGIPHGHPDLNIPTDNGFYGLDDGGNYFETTETTHGGMCASLAAARGMSFVNGVAPAANLLIGRIYDKDSGPSYDALDTALEWAIANHADIISLSIETQIDKDDEGQQKIVRRLKECKDKNIFVFASIGDAGALNRPDENVFPSCIVPCIAIGSYDVNEPVRFRDTTPSKKLSFLLPGNNLLCAIPDGAALIGAQSSASTPFMAGLVALFLSLIRQHKIKLDESLLFQELQNTGKSVVEVIGTETYHYSIPQPLELLNKLIS